MLQDVHYADQLALKKRFLETVLPQSIVPDAVQPSPGNSATAPGWIMYALLTTGFACPGALSAGCRY
jgi:hypothetical protein